MMEITSHNVSRSPFVHTERRSTSSDADKQRLILSVVGRAVGVTRLMPVMHEGRIIAWVGWSNIANAVAVIEHKAWMREWWCTYNSVDDLINNATNNGQLRDVWWFRDHSTASPTGNTWMHTYPMSGSPCSGSFNGTALTARQHTDTEAGAILHGGDVSPATKHLISGWVRESNTATESVVNTAVICIYDMVISYDQCANEVTSQSFTNTLAAQRYVGAGQPGLQIMGCASTIVTGGTAYTNFKYDNLSSVTQTVPGPSLSTFAMSTASGPFYSAITSFACDPGDGGSRGILTLPLVNGDSGVLSLSSYQMGATNTDKFNFILGYPLAWMPISFGLESVHAFDFVKQVSSVPRIYDGACLQIALSVGFVSPILYHGGLTFAWA